MIHDEKIEWMKAWCSNNNCTLELDTTCGYGRKCVGITHKNEFPDYIWYETANHANFAHSYMENMLIPPNAYHKHYCVAVLGTGVSAQEELYGWLKWFDEKNYTIRVIKVPLREIDEFMGLTESFHTTIVPN